MKTIFDYEGIKAPNVPHSNADLEVMYYVYHFLKFHVLFRKNKIAETKRWIILEALKMCKVQVENQVFSLGTPSDVLKHIPTLIDDELKVVFRRNEENSGLSLFKNVEWSYLMNSPDYEGFNTSDGDNPAEYGMNEMIAPVPKKRKSPRTGSYLKKDDWDIANFCEVCNAGIKCKYAFLTPGRVNGIFKVKATSENITSLLEEDAELWNKLQHKIKGWKNRKLDTGQWACEINRYMAKHWWREHYDVNNPEEAPLWAQTNNK